MPRVIIFDGTPEYLDLKNAVLAHSYWDFAREFRSGTTIFNAEHKDFCREVFERRAYDWSAVVKQYRRGLITKYEFQLEQAQLDCYAAAAGIALVEVAEIKLFGAADVLGGTQ